MSAAARAFAWEFRQRHRWGFVAVAAYAIALATVPGTGAYRLGISDGLPEISPRFAAVVLVPATIAFFYFLAVFSFGLAGDLAARRSMYPPRLFTLPVTSEALAGWPMLYGMTAMLVLWFVIARVAPWPPAFDVPVIWPGVFGAVFLAWTQALTWMPYGLRGLRVIVAVLLLTSIDVVVFTAVNYEVAEATLLAFLVPQIPLAYLSARFAVARGRRGDVPDWSGSLARLAPLAERRSNAGRFASSAGAQLWFEWRRRGWSLPAWVALLLPFETALLFAFSQTPRLVIVTVILMLVTPPFMAAFAVASAGGPFMATRPMPTSALVAAQLKMTMWSTATAWLLMLVAVPLALRVSDTWMIVDDQFRRAANAAGVPRAAVVALLVVAGLVLSTWKQLVQGLCIGLSGREWLIKATVFLRLTIAVALIPLAEWAFTPRGVAAIWDWWWWIAGALAAIKMTAAAWVVTRVHRLHLVDDRVLVTTAALWMIAVLSLYGVLVWLVSTPPLISRYLPAVFAILAVPLVRPLVALLALAWNRHR